MIGLIAENETKIDSERLKKLLEMLEIERQPAIDAFLTLPEDEQDFYGLFIEAVTPNFLLIDWKWEPQDIFKRIAHALKGQDVKLSGVEDDETYLAYNVVFSLGDRTAKVTVHYEEPNLLFESINNILDGQEFIAVDFQGDEYAWILTPKGINVRELASLVGCKVIDRIAIKQEGFQTLEELRKQTQFTEHFDVNQPLVTKTSFYPIMYHRVNGELKKLTFRNTQSAENEYHFSVEPGQKLHDTMIEALRKDIAYEGVIEMDWVKPANSDPTVPAYRLQVYLVGDVEPSTMLDGRILSLEDTPEVY